jgi:hypothetical protein
MNPLKVASLSLTLFAVSVLSLSSNAIASDEKTLSGSSCKAYHGYQQSSVRTIYGSISYVTGSSSSNAKQWMVCPLVEDTMAGGSSHNYYAYIYLYHPSSRTTRCYLKTANTYGNGRIYSRSITGSGYKRISWSLGSSYSYQNSSIYCSVDNGPYSSASYGATRILSTRIIEQ